MRSHCANTDERVQMPTGAHFPFSDFADIDGRLPDRSARTESLPKLRDLRDDVFFRAELLYLHNLIKLTGRDIGKACKLSGLSRSRLYTLLKKYRITPR